MSKFILRAALMGLLATAAAAQSATVSGQMTADNTFMINLSYGPGQTTTVVPPTTSWTTAHPVSFEVDTTRLADCTIQILAWNSPTGLLNVSGLQGFLTGNSGTAFTGSGMFRHTTTTVSSSDPVTTADFEAWIAASTQPTTQAGLFHLGVWDATPGFSNAPADMTWIELDGGRDIFGSSDSLYNSFVLPCSAILKDLPPEINPLADDHFACYVPIELQEPSEEVELQIADQFGEAKIVIGRAVLHCNPSKKVHNGEEFGTHNRERHLVCYEIIEQSKLNPPVVRTENQIETNIYTFEPKREMFCVPSLKQEL